MLTTKFAEAFRVEHPIVQDGLQWVGRAELVAAGSACGHVTSFCGNGAATGRLPSLSASRLEPEVRRLDILVAKLIDAVKEKNVPS
jgi:NAD(P)H-dependent flavin oxidoreductase YrpB (nitropropane dioxygenase family)